MQLSGRQGKGTAGSAERAVPEKVRLMRNLFSDLSLEEDREVAVLPVPGLPPAPWQTCWRIRANLLCVRRV